MIITGAPDDDDLLTVEDLAKRGRVSQRTVRRWIKQGKLPSIKIGGLRRVRVRDWKRFISDNS
jgi:excisionase family DNA binding protein